MGRLEKAIERLKAQGTTIEGRPPPRAVRPLSQADAFDELSAGARRVSLDAAHLASQRVIVEGGDLGVRTAYKMLRTRILQRMRVRGWQSIGITSATPGDGKTLTSVNLALSIAGDVNQNVVLVDLDMRHSTIARYLGLPVDQGVSDVLRRGVPLEEALVQPDTDRLLVLPNVHIEDHSSELLASPEMEALTRVLIKDDPSRIVVYDLPPILSADDMLAFAPYVDCVLFVVCERKTKRTDVLRARELLEQTEIIGTVLNRSDERTATYY